jgi:hypothetical protein
VPLPSRRLDLLIVPLPPDRADALDAARALFDAWVAAGAIAADGEPGARAEALIEGGFGRARVDHPPGPALYGNRVGGFRATCPACGENVVPALNAAVAAWRAGGAPALECGACGRISPLEAVHTAPPAAPGRAALVLADASAAALSDEALAAVAEVIGAHRVVAARVGR